MLLYCNHNVKPSNSVGAAIGLLIKSFDTVILLLVLWWSEWIILSRAFSRIEPSHLVLSYLVRLDALVLQE